MKKKAEIIAFYLPQFHPIVENNTWWGEGFTEWTNVGKAKPLFRKHYQPRVPANLGYYDLRIHENQIAQAKMAEDAGLSAFCYWHYWFGDGKRLLEKPLEVVLQKGTPNFPFCLGWANHSWENKNWNSDAKQMAIETLIEQKYPGEKDFDLHFYAMLDAFKDERYYKIKGKLAFLIYRIKDLPDSSLFMQRWQELAAINDLPGFFFIGQTESEKDLTDANFKNCDAVNLSLLKRPFGEDNQSLKFRLQRKLSKITNKPLNVVKYSNAIKYLVSPKFEESNIYPTIIPNWDHSPRLGSIGTIYHQSTPALFRTHVKSVLHTITNKNMEDKIVFLKSWNEWAEGNYMEPDIVFGHGYLDVLKEEILEK